MKVFILFIHTSSANTNSEIFPFVCALPNDGLFDNSGKLELTELTETGHESINLVFFSTIINIYT